MSPTSTLTVRTAAHAGALDDFAGLVHAPAEAGGVPALHGQVAALLVTLGLVGANFAGSRCCLQLAFGHDLSGCERERGENTGTLMTCLGLSTGDCGTMV